jgi:hypothetical protein
MVDSLMADLGIDGSKIAAMGGLVRDARDIQSIAQSRARDGGGSRSGGGGESGGEPPKDGDGGSPSAGGGSRRRSTSRTKK